jgi:hypothetical protein
MSQEAVRKFVQFHRKDPSKIWQSSLMVPDRVSHAGDAKFVKYHSTKVDPSTLRNPRDGQNYIHDFENGVRFYVLDGDDQRVPPFIVQTDAIVRLGDCIGLCYTTPDGEEIDYEYRPRRQRPGLYATPCGHGLMIVREKAKPEILGLLWGGTLRVESRGIVG